MYPMNKQWLFSPKRKRFDRFENDFVCFSSGSVTSAGRTPPTAEIDHYIPLDVVWHLIPTDTNSDANLQALCPNCHAPKQ